MLSYTTLCFMFQLLRRKNNLIVVWTHISNTYLYVVIWSISMLVWLTDLTVDDSYFSEHPLCVARDKATALVMCGLKFHFSLYRSNLTEIKFVNHYQHHNTFITESASSFWLSGVFSPVETEYNECLCKNNFTWWRLQWLSSAVHHWCR